MLASSNLIQVIFILHVYKNFQEFYYLIILNIYEKQTKKLLQDPIVSISRPPNILQQQLFIKLTTKQAQNITVNLQISQQNRNSPIRNTLLTDDMMLPG